MSKIDHIDPSLLKHMQRYVKKRLSLTQEESQDFVSKAYERALKALKKKGLDQLPNSKYLWKTLKTVIVDFFREKQRQSIPQGHFKSFEQDQSKIISKISMLDVKADYYAKLNEYQKFWNSPVISPDTRKVEPSLNDHPHLICHIDRLSKTEREVLTSGLMLKKEKNEDQNSAKWSKIAEVKNDNSTNLRKRYSRALRKIHSSLILQLYQEERYDEINRYRLSRKLMEDVTQLLLQQNSPISCFEGVFQNPNRNRAIQNATWALISLAKKKPEGMKFLERQFFNSNLYRGNLTYIVEGFIDHDSKHYADFIRKYYFSQLLDLPSRVHEDCAPFIEQEPVHSRCLIDIINFKPVGAEVPGAEIERIRKLFLSGMGDVDLHRTLAWMLLRIVPDGFLGMKTAVNSLVDERDQTNAYYVTRFIMGFGLKMFPEILVNNQTLNSIKAIKRRWPQNLYFAESAARISMKLKQMNLSR